MNHIKTLAIPILVLSAIFFVDFPCHAETDLLALGDHLSDIGNYDAAITEYKRFLFFHPDDSRVPKTYREIGMAYRAQGMFQESIIALRNSVQYSFDKEERSENQLDLAVVLIASKNYDLARLETIKVLLRSPSGPQHRRALFLQGVATIYQFRWEEARDVLKKYMSDDKLETLLDEAIKLPKKSTRTAKVFSAILPGTGQMYAGEWSNGLNALLLNGVLGYVTINSLLNRDYVDALLWTYFIFQRYYRGSLYRAGKAAEDYNKDVSHRAADRILNRLQEIVTKQ